MGSLDTSFMQEDIHEIAEYISTVLKKSVIIENEKFELIAYGSPADFHFDSTQQTTILSKKCPLFIIEHLKKEGIIQQLEWKREPIRVAQMEEIGLDQRIVISVKHNERTVGYIWVLEATAQLTEWELQFLKDISLRVGKLMYQHNVKSHKSKKDHRLIWKLMNNEYVNEQQVYREARLASLWLPERFVVMVVSSVDSTHLTLLEETVRNLEKVKAASYIDGTKLVVAIGGVREQEDTALVQARSVTEELKSKNKACFIGIGNEYCKLGNIRKSYLQALEVIEIGTFVGQNAKVPFEYAKLGMYRYLPLLFEKNTSEQFINYDLLALLQKDEETKSRLLETLEVFLENHCKVKKTASQLFIHPNTLNYRIKQIQELTQINFEDFNMNSHLYSELLLLNHIAAYYQRYQEALLEDTVTKSS
ncbi:PucR family transcriptional regulator [Halalkalibacter flavus]|uniref:PucR family transcriptional regulator n=1 Tax=Halalkalibacter flavus TaxID=3090668 RepID=UPI002FC8B155